MTQSYQLPDLLSLLTSLNSDNGDGELHINPAYQSVADSSVAWLLDNIQHSGADPAETSRLQKTLRGFLHEYNPGLLASTYFPFVLVSKTPSASSPSKLQVATEWLGVCAIVVEGTLRPGRIIDHEFSTSSVDLSAVRHTSGLGDFLGHSVLRCTAPHLSYFRSPDAEELLTPIQDLLSAHIHPPPKPNPSEEPSSAVVEYLKWRVALSGHRVLAELFLPLQGSRRAQRLLAITLEIIACVMDLFAYNIHQAWHANPPSDSNNDRGHLNLIAFLRAGDPELTLQGAVNVAGEMIRGRIAEVKELAALQQTSLTADPPMEPGSVLATLFPTFFSENFSTPVDPIRSPARQRSDVATDVDDQDSFDEVRRALLCWLTGVVHWAYEVDHFLPNASNNSEHQTGARGMTAKERKKRKRGSEIRDYGWVFLIKTEEVEEHTSS